ncbi:uncharacterized protein LOC62_03G004367 [Vanrija pseudolonga]|uniref:Myb-like domain-containing protein n=1 Tax=Vanrija pseudolonga TaxID=143232 RepID=A0AAF0Y9W3_9TREE|nr:hypothetical protein LOC62_03G004367 [Vanrija pseudolonga]
MPAERKPRVHPATSSSTDSKGSKADKPKQRKKPEFWTANEDRILHELLAAIAKKQIWASVQADGRLAHKGCSGIHMRLKTLLGKGATLPKP